ncbi:MAG: hypothetical protein WC716_05095 [Chitinophagaceae bacterium]
MNQVKKILKISLASAGILMTSSSNAQSWVAAGGNLNTTAAKVGIGTTTPTEKLTIQNGNLSLTNSAYPSDYGSSNWRYITAKTDVAALHIGTNPNIATGEANGPMIQMLAKENLWLPGRINYQARSSIIPVSGGSVGTTVSHHFINWNPVINDWVNQLSLLDIDNMGVAAIGFTHELPTSSTHGLSVERGISVRSYTSFSAYRNLFDVKDISGKAVAIIGDVPLPSTPNAYGLLVQNGILTEKVRVAIPGTPEWADYVFADDYKLMPLKQLEAFIEEENHLPEVPSAEEVVKDGVDLGQMQAKLLQKVEELTLYVIQQQKEIDTLKKQVAKTKKSEQ